MIVKVSNISNIQKVKSSKIISNFIQSLCDTLILIDENRFDFVLKNRGNIEEGDFMLYTFESIKSIANDKDKSEKFLKLKEEFVKNSKPFNILVIM